MRTLASVFSAPRSVWTSKIKHLTFWYVILLVYRSTHSITTQAENAIRLSKRSFDRGLDLVNELWALIFVLLSYWKFGLYTADGNGNFILNHFVFSNLALIFAIFLYLYHPRHSCLYIICGRKSQRVTLISFPKIYYN